MGGEHAGEHHASAFNIVSGFEYSSFAIFMVFIVGFTVAFEKFFHFLGHYLELKDEKKGSFYHHFLIKLQGELSILGCMSFIMTLSENSITIDPSFLHVS